MAHIKRLITVIAAGCGLALVLPARSLATLSEVGVIPETTPATVPSCPTPSCLAVSRTTGFQVKVETNNNLEAAPEREQSWLGRSASRPGHPDQVGSPPTYLGLLSRTSAWPAYYSYLAHTPLPSCWAQASRTPGPVPVLRRLLNSLIPT